MRKMRKKWKFIVSISNKIRQTRVIHCDANKNRIVLDVVTLVEHF